MTVGELKRALAGINDNYHVVVDAKIPGEGLQISSMWDSVAKLGQNFAIPVVRIKTTD